MKMKRDNYSWHLFFWLILFFKSVRVCVCACSFFGSSQRKNFLTKIATTRLLIKCIIKSDRQLRVNRQNWREGQSEGTHTHRGRNTFQWQESRMWKPAHFRPTHLPTTTPNGSSDCLVVQSVQITIAMNNNQANHVASFPSQSRWHFRRTNILFNFKIKFKSNDKHLAQLIELLSAKH